MADGLIVQLEEFKDYLGNDVKKSGGEKDSLLTDAILSAEDMVRGQCSDNFDQRAYTDEYHSGTDRPHLWARHLPVAISPLPVVTENGAALVVAAGYSSSANVVFEPTRGVFSRMAGGAKTTWLIGENNVNFSYTGGYLLGLAPRDLRLLVKFVAALVWQESDRNQYAVKRRSGQQGSTEFWDDIPPLYKAIVQRYAVPIHGE